MAVPAATPPAGPQANSLPPSPTGALEEWDRKELTLQRAVWRLYAATTAYGPDTRGRTIADDLNARVMTPNVRAVLKKARIKAAHQVQTGDAAGAQAIWESASRTLDEQLQRLSVVGLYWSERMPLERLRALWLGSLSRAPQGVATNSRARIESLVSQLTSDYASAVDVGALTREIAVLTGAYDEERRKIAALVSQRRVAAGEVIASRDRSVSCSEVVAAADTDTNRRNGRAGGDTPDPKHRPPQILTSPAAEQYYPEAARKASISGDVILQVTVGVDGCMKHAEVVSSSGVAELDDGALELVEWATFRPAQAEGRVLEASFKMKYRFTLRNDEAVSAADDAAAHVTRGNDLMNRGQLDEALAELDKAIALQPRNSVALADRGLAYVWKREFEHAKADLDEAYSIHPLEAVVSRGRGLLALRLGDAAGAASAFTDALQRDPQDLFSLQVRSEAYVTLGDFDHALADIRQIARIKPGRTDTYAQIATILRAQHKMDEALSQAEAVVASSPNDAHAALAAGAIYAASGRKGEAMRSFDRAVELGGGAAAYLQRAAYRPRADAAQRRADLEAALKLNPKSEGAPIALADLEAQSGNTARAIEILSGALADRPDDPTLLARRGIAYLKDHQDSLAAQDFEKVSASAKTASALNSLCWSLATAGVELGRALSACDAALAKAPMAADIEDSRAFVLLRLGRVAESIKVYSEALKLRPLSTSTLYGRGIARRRAGDVTGGDADVAVAMSLDARTAETFAGYGISG